ncbi:MAG: hypothetical protein WAT37_16915 [Saprospiraceae bacterium]|jgi:hypothetical protein|nr:hypothetical protein [Saprospiraceae bacterium]
MKNSLFSVPVIFTYLALFLLMSFTSDSTKEQKDVKYFTLKKGDSPMTSEVKSKLTAAYKAQYGKKSVIESIKLEEINGATWLVFNSGSNSNPTVAYQTYKKPKPDDTTTVPSDAPKETCTGNPCSVCQFGRSGGCWCAEGSCNHTISRITDDQNFMAILFN